jgi:tetratricopeptide (TPR) repeat protein
MQALLPLLLLGGVVGVALHQVNPTTAPTPPTQKAVAAEGLGGYLQAVVGGLNDDATTTARGYLGALSADPDNLTLRQRALETALASGDTATALRLAKSLPPETLLAMARVLLLAEAVRVDDLKAAREQLRALRASTPELPLLAILDGYLAAAEGTAPNKLIPVLQATTQGWSGAWHSARLWLDAANPATAVALLEPVVAKYPGAYLPVAQLWPLVSPARQQELTHNFVAYNPGLAPLLVAPIRAAAPAQEILANNTAAALIEFGLQIWAEGVPLLAQQILNIATLLPIDDPLLGQLLPYYRAVLADDAGQRAQAAKLYQHLAEQPNGFGQLAQLRLTELKAAEATTPRARRQAAQAARALAHQHLTLPVFWHSALQLSLVAEEYPQAAKVATTLIALTPQDPSNTFPQRQAEGYFARGAAYAQAKQSPEAETDLRRAIELNPAHAEALNYLGFLWVDENRNLEEAYSLLKRAHLLAPNNGAITDSVGWAYFRKGDYPTALQYLELAAQQEPGTPEILSHLADTYFKLGQLEEARKLWQRALDFANQGATVPSGTFLQDLQQKVRDGVL